MARQASCLCGTCRKCKWRIYMRRYYQSKSPGERHRIFCAGRDPDRLRVVDSYAYRVARDPEKVQARDALRDAVLHGRLSREACEVCGDPKTEGHHDDYAKPLDVRWLCVQHHTEVHHPYLVVVA